MFSTFMTPWTLLKVLPKKFSTKLVDDDALDVSLLISLQSTYIQTTTSSILKLRTRLALVKLTSTTQTYAQQNLTDPI
jgi:hypothetical protein